MCSRAGVIRSVVERSTDEPCARPDHMNENNDDRRTSISNASSSEEIGEYWDSHCLADYWDQTHEVEFEIRARFVGTSKT